MVSRVTENIPQLNFATVSLPAAPHGETQAPSRVKKHHLSFPSLSFPFSSTHHFSIDQFDSHPQPSIQNGDPRDPEEEQNAPQSPRRPRDQRIPLPCHTVLFPCRRRLHHFLPNTHRTLPRPNPLSIRPAYRTVHVRNVLESMPARDLSWEEDLGVRYGMLVL